MTGEEALPTEEARKVALAWITKAESLLDSAALLETTRPRGWIDPEERGSLIQRCERLAQPWGPKFSKAVLLLGLAEADGRRAHDAFRHLAVIIELAESVIAGATSVDAEEARDDCLAALAKMRKLAAADKKIWPQMDGRPTAEPMSLEVFGKRAKADKTLPTIGAEAKAIAEEVKKRIHMERFDIKPPSPRTVENHIRKKFLGR